MTDQLERDPFDVRRAIRAPGLLRPFNDAGVLRPADVHVARRLAELGEEDDDLVVLAIAFAVRAPRLGSVYADLGEVRAQATSDLDDVDLTALPWPDPDEWVARTGASELVATGEDGPDDRPLRLLGTKLHLDRFHREERDLAVALRALTEEVPGVHEDLLRDGLHRLFRRREQDPETAQMSLLEGRVEEGPDLQRAAAAAAVHHRFAVVAGGPGTGKTTTVARIVALLDEQAEHAGQPRPLVALAAPTGRAATRLQEAVHHEADELVEPDPRLVERLKRLEATTLHRLLGARPGRRRPLHGRANRLPHDVVIVDETSMVSLELMARLVEAVRPDARLVLVGDPGQLRSVDAGAVLGDIVGDATQPHVTVLTRVRRYGRGIGRVADAVRDDDADAALAALHAAPDEVTWLPFDAADPDHRAEVDATLSKLATDTFITARDHAAKGEAAQALEQLAGLRLLCAHRRGPHGVAWWTAQVERWLGDLASDHRFAVGKPLLVTENDPALQLNNGDLGVVVADPRGDEGRVLAAFDRRPDPLLVSPSRLAAVEPAYVMTVHKAQGGQVGTAVVLLPPPSSPLLTRELLYTAITRAQRHLVLVGTEEALRTAIGRPALRASGLRERLRS